MEKVAEVFRGGGKERPPKWYRWKQDIQILQQIKCDKNQDLATKQWKAFTPFFLRHLYHKSMTVRALLISNLETLGFFSMRSCEYILALCMERKQNL